MDFLFLLSPSIFTFYQRIQSTEQTKHIMPPHHHHDHHHHHHHRYAEWRWQDLPASAQAAAQVLGYTETTWNESKVLPFVDKPWDQLSNDQKRAAVYLSKSPMDYWCDDAKNPNFWWKDLSPKGRQCAQVLGWDERAWDQDYAAFEDVKCYGWWWNDMTPEQREAMEYFGYNQNLWDRMGQEEVFDGKGSTVSIEIVFGRYGMKNNHVSLYPVSHLFYRHALIMHHQKQDCCIVHS